MRQVKVGLPDNTREWLEGFARINRRSLSEEARARIDQSMHDDRFDAATQDLGRDIMWLAHMVTDGARRPDREPSWSKDASVFGALKVAVEAWLAKTEQKLQLNTTESPAVDPATLGRATAAHYERLKATMAKHAAEAEGKEEYEQ